MSSTLTDPLLTIEELRTQIIWLLIAKDHADANLESMTRSRDNHRAAYVDVALTQNNSQVNSLQVHTNNNQQALHEERLRSLALQAENEVLKNRVKTLFDLLRSVYPLYTKIIHMWGVARSRAGLSALERTLGEF